MPAITSDPRSAAIRITRFGRDRKKVIVTLYVVTPRPPLLAFAGIVGIVACKPKPALSDKFVVVRVLSSSQPNHSVP